MDSKSRRRKYKIGALMLSALTLMAWINGKTVVRADDQYCYYTAVDQACYDMPSNECGQAHPGATCRWSYTYGCTCVQ
jgi:hypothetical protein